MLEEFQNISFDTIDAGFVLTALGVAFACGLFISLVYQWSYKGSSYSATFVRSMIFMSMITAVVMLAVGNSLARAFALVGAMSIIRFRTAIKDPLDIVFVFFSLAIGLAAGVGMFKVAFLGTAVIGLIVFLTARTNYGVRNRRSFLLQLNYDAPQENGSTTYLPVLQKYCKRHDLVNARAAATGDLLNLTFYVNLRNTKDVEALTRELGQAKHVRDVNLFYDEKED